MPTSVVLMSRTVARLSSKLDLLKLSTKDDQRDETDNSADSNVEDTIVAKLETSASAMLLENKVSRVVLSARTAEGIDREMTEEGSSMDSVGRINSLKTLGSEMLSVSVEAPGKISEVTIGVIMSFEIYDSSEVGSITFDALVSTRTRDVASKPNWLCKDSKIELSRKS